jgi:ribosomal protein S18 acetylase RimI-like enzyme
MSTISTARFASPSWANGSDERQRDRDTRVRTGRPRCDHGGDQVVGVVHAAEREHFTGQVDAYVGELVTAPGRERRGIGRALTAAAEAWGAARGLAYLTLRTGAANEKARAFYAALGYLEEDVRLTKRIRTGTG